MNCPNCSALVNEDVEHCPYCGFDLTQARAQEQQAVAAQPQPPSPQPDPYAQPGYQQPQQAYQQPQQGYQQPQQGYQQPQQGYQQPQQGYQQPQAIPAPPPKPSKDPMLAAGIELGAGSMLQTFGIGNIYAGSVAIGVILMLSYWILQFINILLTMVFIGFITLPLTWIIYMVIAPLLAYNAAKKT